MPKFQFALLLEFSRLLPPLPRPHHRRVARAILEAAAARHDGDVFDLACGDLVLLCRAPTHLGEDPATHPATLPHALSRLLRADLPAGVELVTTWALEHDGGAVLAFAAGLAG